MDELVGLVGEQSAGHSEPCLAESLCATARNRGRVVERVDHARDASRDEGFAAWAGTAIMVTRLEGDHGGESGRIPAQPGEGVDFGVRGACAAVPALGDDLSRRIKQHAADLRVDSGYRSAGGEGESAAHGLLDRGVADSPGVHPEIPVESNCRLPTDSGLKVGCSKFHRPGAMARPIHPCCLPSGLSASSH
jgi:hypothetical protein